MVTFTRHFRHYLLGRKFLVRTDHSSLVWITRFRNPEGQLARWLEELQQYDVQILHRQGRKHSNADGLSRIPDGLEQCDCYRAGLDLESLPCGGCAYCHRAHQQWQRFDELVDDVVPLAVRSVYVPPAVSPETSWETDPVTLPAQSSTILAAQAEVDQDEVTTDSDSEGDDELGNIEESNWVSGRSFDALRTSQLADADLSPLLIWKESKEEPSQHQLFLSSPATKSFWLCKDQLVVRDGVLFYRWIGDSFPRECFMVPQPLRAEVLFQCHDTRSAGHLGQAKTLLRARRSFLWYQMAKDCRLHVQTCSVCNQNKKASRHARAGLGRYHAGFPMERVHLDILGPFVESSKGRKYILVMVDQYSKWIELAAISDQTAQTIAQEFLQHFVVTFGCPLQVHTDQGRNFDSNLFSALCDLLEIAKTRTTPYRPCSNGQVERYNSVVLAFVRCFSEGNPRSWDEHLPLLSMALHSMVHRQTGFSANQVMLGREVLQPIDLLLGTVRESVLSGPCEWVSRLASQLNKVHQFVRERLGASQLRQKRDYDLKLCEHQYNVGDVVYRVDSSTKVGAKALKPVWRGPYLVVGSAFPLYHVRTPRRKVVLHHDRLKLCLDRVIPLWLRRLRHGVLQGDNQPPEPEHDEEEGMLGLFQDPEGGTAVEPDQAAGENTVNGRNAGAPRAISGNMVNDHNTDDAPLADPNANLQHAPTPVTDDITAPIDAPNVTRAGRASRKPKHLRDYVLD